MKPTALGDYVLVLPDRGAGWEVAVFSAAGNYKGGALKLACAVAAAARDERRRLVALHKGLAAEAAARKAKRAKGK